jgi:hypothetical protein
MPARDDFTSEVIRRLGETVNLHCSNCDAPTKAGHPALPHASHIGQAAAVQQTPSTQWPLAHSGADAQALPSALVDAQTPATQ